MAEQAALAVCPYAVDDLRQLLGDADGEYTYAEGRVDQALRDNRATVYFRDPGFATSGVNPFLWYRGKVHVPPTNPDDSLLQAEPGERSFQAGRHVRHWDSQATVDVWKNGIEQTLTTDYTINHREGRVTFVADVDDWETVNASFCYYRIYHAARDILTMELGRQRTVSVKLSDNTYTFSSPREAVAMLDRVIANIGPQTVRPGKRMY